MSCEIYVLEAFKIFLYNVDDIIIFNMMMMQFQYVVYKLS